MRSSKMIRCSAFRAPDDPVEIGQSRAQSLTGNEAVPLPTLPPRALASGGEGRRRRRRGGGLLSCAKKCPPPPTPPRRSQVLRGGRGVRSAAFWARLSGALLFQVF